MQRKPLPCSCGLREAIALRASSKIHPELRVIAPRQSATVANSADPHIPLQSFAGTAMLWQGSAADRWGKNSAEWEKGSGRFAPDVNLVNPGCSPGSVGDRDSKDVHKREPKSSDSGRNLIHGYNVAFGNGDLSHARSFPRPLVLLAGLFPVRT